MTAAQAQVVTRRRGRRMRVPALDYWLLGAAFLLLALGFVMVASASPRVGRADDVGPRPCLLRTAMAGPLSIS